MHDVDLCKISPKLMTWGANFGQPWLRGKCLVTCFDRVFVMGNIATQLFLYHIFIVGITRLL